MTYVPGIVIAGLLMLPVAVDAEQPQSSGGGRTSTETTVALASDGRVELGGCTGRLVVRTWDRDEVRVRATHELSADVRITERDQVVAIRSTAGQRRVDYELTVPAGVGLHAQGVACDVDIEGVTGAVEVATVDGDIVLSRMSGHVVASTVEGQISVAGGDGRLQLSTVEGAVRITGAAGEISAQSVDGDILLTDLTCAAIDVSTVDGDVTFSGAFLSGGRYQFTTHDGDIVLTIPANSSAILGVRTFDGDLDSAVNLTLTSDGGRGRRRRVFTMGAGSARVEVETFDGDVRIRRRE
jgi:DUF4097 and DUF4098 domain-containing protein YvlB